MIWSVLSALFLGAGALFLLFAALGSIKFPDLFLRMAAVSKASTLGVVLTALGAAFHFGEPMAWIKMLVLVGFFLLSAPIAAHLLGRAAFRNGTPLFPGTKTPPDADRI